MPIDRERLIERSPGLARRLRRDMTMPERQLWYALRDRRLSAWKFRRQAPIGPFVVDFYCHTAGLILEIDGRSHDDRGEADLARQAELESLGLRLFRMSNDDVLDRMEDVLVGILKILNAQDEPRPAPFSP